MKKLLAGLLGLGIVACAISDPETLLAAPKKPSANAPKFSIADTTCGEGEGICRLTITKTGTARSASVVRVRTANGTAISGSDFTNFDQDVSFAKNVTQVEVQVYLVSDTIYEGTESFKVNMTAGSNANIVDGQAIVTLTDDEVPAPTTKLCADGTTVPINDACPSDPPEEEEPDWEVSPNGLTGETPIASNFDITTTYTSGWGVAPSMAPDVVGAFRFTCGSGQLSYNDPIVYPGQEGASHLHQYYGNTLTTYNSTFSSLRTTGGSTCNNVGDNTTAANRSAYWIPAMLNGAGKVVQPDYVLIYYKSYPASAPQCAGLAAGGVGTCLKIPHGLKFIFGYDMVTGKSRTGKLYWTCKGVGAVPGNYQSIPAAKANCPVGTQLGAIMIAPSCWDGRHLDSPNHRDHVSYGVNGKCPSTHPYLIPEFTLHVWYSVEAGDNLDNWYAASDSMHPELAHGTTFHADFWMAWDAAIRDRWHNNCINLLLSCAAGNMGDDTGLRGTVPKYLINGVLTSTWKHPNRLVDVPVDPAP